MGEPALVPLYDRLQEVIAYALVDPEDLPLVSGYRWSLDDQGYASRWQECRRMHRLLLPTGPDEVVDHINRNRLDNRRANLRAVDRQENGANTSSRGGRSVHRGVYFDTRKEVWYGQYRHRGKTHVTRAFATEQEALTALIHLRAVVLGEVVDTDGLLTRVHNAKKRACKRGHPFDVENTHIRPNGQRTCATCRREYHREYGKRRRQAAKAAV